jgi:hypothetical protein
MDRVLEESIMLINKYKEAIESIITYLEKKYSPSVVTVIGFCFGSYLSLKFNYLYKETQLVLWSIDVSAYDKYCKIFSLLSFDHKDINVPQDYNNLSDNGKKTPLLIINGDYIKNQNKNRDAILRILPRKKFDMNLKIFCHCDEHFSTLSLKTNLINQTLKWLNNEYEKRENFE